VVIRTPVEKIGFLKVSDLNCGMQKSQAPCHWGKDKLIAAGRQIVNWYARVAFGTVTGQAGPASASRTGNNLSGREIAPHLRLFCADCDACEVLDNIYVASAESLPYK
jgi:hypothetical protein